MEKYEFWNKCCPTGEGNGKPLQYSCLENPMNSMKRQNDRTLKDELPGSVGAQYATGDQWRNNSRKNEGMEPKQKQYPAVDVTGDRSKVWCCKEQYCIGPWNVRSMNQGNLEVVKQEMARVNINILRHTYQFSSVQFSHSVVSDSLWPHESQHARPPCPSPTPRVHSNSRPSSQWRHPAISSSFSSCPQSLPASESFPMSPLISSSILGAYWPGEFLFQYPIILPFHTVHGVLKARILKWFEIGRAHVWTPVTG